MIFKKINNVIEKISLFLKTKESKGYPTDDPVASVISYGR